MHIATSLYVMTVTLTVLSGAMFLIWRATKNIPGPLPWALGEGLGAIGVALLLGRAVLPDVITIWFANFAITASYALIFLGICQFVNRTFPTKLILALLALYGGTFAFYTWIEPDIHARVALNAFTQAALLMVMANTLFRYQVKGCLQGQLAGATILTISALVVFSVLLVFMLSDLGTSSLFDHPVVKIRTAAAPGLTFAWGLALVYMTLLRVIAAEREAKEEAARAKQIAEEANRAKTEFLANMSHEVRTPLNAIIGFAGAIKEETFGPIDNSRYLEYLDDILASGHHLDDLINDILDVSAIESGMLNLTEESLDFTAVAQAAQRMVSRRAEAGNISLITKIENDLPPLYADQRRLMQILVNLLSNAVKFTLPGGRVEMSAKVGPSGAFHVDITDTGIGMSPEEINIALNKFQQLDSGLNRKWEGTGLGLPLTDSLVKLLGGNMAIDSHKGEGTRVTVYLPEERVLNSN